LTDNRLHRRCRLGRMTVSRSPPRPLFADRRLASVRLTAVLRLNDIVMPRYHLKPQGQTVQQCDNNQEGHEDGEERPEHLRKLGVRALVPSLERSRRHKPPGADAQMHFVTVLPPHSPTHRADREGQSDYRGALAEWRTPSTTTTVQGRSARSATVRALRSQRWGRAEKQLFRIGRRRILERRGEPRRSMGLGSQPAQGVPPHRRETRFAWPAPHGEGVG
jgi:hypothetical protein